MNGFASQGGPADPDAEDHDVELPVPAFDRPGDDPQAGVGQRTLRHQHRRRRPLRPLSGLGRGRRAILGGQADHQRHGAGRRGVPADVGARTGSARRAAPRVAARRRRAPGRRAGPTDAGGGPLQGLAAPIHRRAEAAAAPRLRPADDAGQGGQPSKKRSDSVWEWCVQKRAGSPKKRVVAVFDESGRVAVIASTLRNGRAGRCGADRARPTSAAGRRRWARACGQRRRRRRVLLPAPQGQDRLHRGRASIAQPGRSAACSRAPACARRDDQAASAYPERDDQGGTRNRSRWPLPARWRLGRVRRLGARAGAGAEGVGRPDPAAARRPADRLRLRRAQRARRARRRRSGPARSAA